MAYLVMMMTTVDCQINVGEEGSTKIINISLIFSLYFDLKFQNSILKIPPFIFYFWNIKILEVRFIKKKSHQNMDILDLDFGHIAQI